MNEPDVKVKQQIVEKIKNSTNILITVSKNPSVDELSAALGLTAILNKIEKHGTAIFSGSIPPAIEFLDPEKTFENTVDSLRDFIIALDKEKADHLRYKVEGDYVKIFITPYRTTITGDDLEFSQGDFNVELVIALGVESQDDLDAALAAHGRILHDVTVATFSAGEQISRLGSLDWHDENASCLSEMVTSISEALKGDKTILDKQIATALLTGIVAATDRFSNSKTSSRIMTMAAQLMAAGADQQLIAAKLQESHEIGNMSQLENSTKVKESDEAMPIQMDESKTDSTLPPVEPENTGRLEITHEEMPEPIPTSQTIEAPETQQIEYANDQTDAQPVLPDNQTANIDTQSVQPETPQIITEVSGIVPQDMVEPSFGGSLNSTTSEAAEKLREEINNQQNKTILSHSYLGDTDPNTNVSSMGEPAAEENQENIDIFATSQVPSTISTLGNEKTIEPPSQQGNTLRSQLTVPVPDLPMPPPLPDFSTLPPPPPPPTDISAAPTAPADGNMSTLPPNNADPGQFKIPS